MTHAARPPDRDDVIAKSTLRRFSLRIGLLLFVVYILNFLDRTNVGLAKLDMQPDLGLSEAAFGLGSGLFFIGYVLFEIPSNIILNRVGARLWITRILVSWGLVSMAMSLVQSEWTFYTLRFLLGVAEAGLVPGVLLYLSQWVPAQHRARLVGMFYLAVPIASAIGGPLGIWLMTFEPWGLAGWQFLFLAEGFPCLLLAVVVLRKLTDKPEQAHWLTAEQRTWLIGTLAAEESDRSAMHQPWTLAMAVRNRGVLGMTAVFFAMIIPIYALQFFLPTIINQMGNFSRAQVGLLFAVPFSVASVAMWFLSCSSDRTGERNLHYVVPAAIGAIGLVVGGLTITSSPAVAMSGFTLGAVGCISTLPAFWAHAPYLLSGSDSVTGIAFITAVGNIAGFVSPYMVALIKGEGPGLGNASAAIIVTAAFLAAAAVLMYGVGNLIVKRTAATRLQSSEG